MVASSHLDPYMTRTASVSEAPCCRLLASAVTLVGRRSPMWSHHNGPASHAHNRFADKGNDMRLVSVKVASTVALVVLSHLRPSTEVRPYVGQDARGDEEIGLRWPN